MKTSLKIFTEAENDKNALVVLNKIKNIIKFIPQSENCEPYHKGGYVCRVEIDIPSSSWEEIPYKLLSLCQSIGRAWVISGNIEEEFDAWSNESNISGIGSLHVQCLHRA